MLSRAQEARVREVLGSHSPGTIQTYCLEHLAVAGKIIPRTLLPSSGAFGSTGSGRPSTKASVMPTRTRRSRC